MKSLKVNIVFRGASEMQELNKKYRKKDYIPNVLTFGEDLREVLIRWPLEEGEDLEKLIAHGIMDLLEEREVKQTDE